MFLKEHFHSLNIGRNEIGIRHIKVLIEKAGFAQIRGLYLAQVESI